MATLAQFRTAVGRKLNLQTDASGDERDAVDAWLNEGVRDVLRETRCKVTTQTITPGATQNYTLDTSTALTGALAIVALRRGGDGDEVERVTVDELLEYRRTGASTGSDVTHYALAGHDLILFYPTPAAADTFTLYFVPVPTTLSASNHDAVSATYGGVPVELHKAIEYYALAEGADYDSDGRSGDGVRYWQMYERELGKARRMLNRRGGTKIPRARPPSLRTRRPFNDTV